MTTKRGWLFAAWVETACGKRGYRGRRSAVSAAKGTKYIGQYSVAGLHAYYCRDCGFWHVGHARSRAVEV